MRLQHARQMSAGRRVVNYWFSGMLLALTTALILEGALSLALPIGWLIAINAFTALYYGIDKLNAIYEDDNPQRKAEKTRVPEWSLLLLAFVGGSPAAVLSMLLLWHKVKDGWFLFRFVAVLAAQGAALYLLWDRLPVL